MNRQTTDGPASASLFLVHFPTPRLNYTESLNQQLVELETIGREVGPTMAIGTNTDDIFRAVRAAVGEPMHVMAFDVPRAVCSLERATVTALLAVPLGTAKHIVTNVAATREYGAICRDAFWGRSGGFICDAPQLLQLILIVGNYGINVIDVFGYVAHTAELEYDCISNIVILVRRRPNVVALINHFAFVSQSADNGCEQVDGLPAFPGLHDRTIAGSHLHRAFLTLSEIFEDAVWTPAIGIAVLVAFIAAYQKNYGGVGRCDDAALSLPIVDAVDICGSIVDLTDNKRHEAPVLNACSLMGCGPFCIVKEAA